MQARLRHAAALEMIGNQRAGKIEAAREWRSIIKTAEIRQFGRRRARPSATRCELHRSATRSVDCSPRNMSFGRSLGPAKRLTRCFGSFMRDRATPAPHLRPRCRSSGLSQFASFFAKTRAPDRPLRTELARQESDVSLPLLAAASENASQLPGDGQRRGVSSLEAGYPNLLSAEDIERRERIVLKLLRLIPKEYQSGVRDGEITIPIEYRGGARVSRYRRARSSMS